MRGRRPSGPEYVHLLSGSAQAKERLQTVLETLAGTCRVQEACARLGISEPRFHQLRERVLEAALGELEARPRGRPPRTLSAAEAELAKLQQQLADQEVELRAAQVREEISLVLPRARQDAKPAADAAEQAGHTSSNNVPANRSASDIPGSGATSHDKPQDDSSTGPEKKTRRPSPLPSLRRSRRRSPAKNKPM
jgi:hypothetical protein